MSQILSDKIIPFFRKNFYLLILAVFAIALLLRIKYFMLNSAIWFDEAEYLSIARYWAFDIPFDIHYVRPILFSLIAAFFYKLGFGETFFRFGVLAFSFFGIVSLYYLGKELFNKYVGLSAAFAMSFFYTHLFYTGRILLGLPTTTLWTIIAILFWKGYVKKENKYYILLLGPLVSLGILVRFPVGIIAGSFLAYLLITEGFKFLKNKFLWISVGISVLPMIPYFIWYYNKYKLIAIIGAGEYYQPAGGSHIGSFFSLGWGYLKWFPTLYFNSKWYLLFILFLVGVFILFFNLGVGFDLIRKDRKLKAYLLTFLLFLMPFIYFTGFQGHIEPRYIFYCFPSMFLVLGLGVVGGYDFLKKYSKDIALILVVVALIVGSYTHYQFSEPLIDAKKDSYVQLKYAGEWIKENSVKGDKVISSGAPQMTYYSDREIIGWPEKEEDMWNHIEETGAKYMVLTLLEGSSPWSYGWPEKNKDRVIPVQSYMMENGQPILVIYGFVEEVE